MADLGSNGFTFDNVALPDGTARFTSLVANHAPPPRIAVQTYGAGLGVTLLDHGNTPHPKLETIAGASLYRLAGTAKVDGVASAGIAVKAFDRGTGALLGSTISGDAGAFEIVIPGYDGTYPAMVVAFDPDGAPDYNAAVKDKITAVSA